MTDKLAKVNVPELFVQRFILNVAPGTSSIVDKLQVTTPRARGRGLTRLVENITEAEWNDLYQRAAAIRTSYKGDTRTAAICAKAMATRMEKLGVSNPVQFETRVARKIREAEEAAATPQLVTDGTPVSDSEETSEESTTPPIDLDLSNEEDVTDEDLDRFKTELGMG